MWHKDADVCIQSRSLHTHALKIEEVDYYSFRYPTLRMLRIRTQDRMWRKANPHVGGNRIFKINRCPYTVTHAVSGPVSLLGQNKKKDYQEVSPDTRPRVKEAHRKGY